MTETQIWRVADPGDAPAVKNLTQDAYRYFLDDHGYWPKPATHPYDEWIIRGEVHVCEQNGRLVAALVLEPESDWMMIYSVAVTPRAQGQGLGRQLIQLAEQQARDADYSEIRLYTNSLMHRNIAIYSHMGYEEFARIPHDRREGQIVVHMRKQLPRV